VDAVSLPDLWRRDGLAGMRTRAGNARRSLQGLQDQGTRYARTLAAAADAWAAAAAAFDQSWRASGLLLHPPDTCPDCDGVLRRLSVDPVPVPVVRCAGHRRTP